jgi:DNA-binding CsgD family transcriptional regulator
LVNFIAYFKITAAHFIRKAERSILVWEDVCTQQKIHLREEVRSSLWKQQNIKMFTQALKQTHYPLAIDGDEYQITAREMDCLYYLQRGYSAKLIARSLGVSPRTVEDHLARVREKLSCYNKTELLLKLGDSLAFYTPCINV